MHRTESKYTNKYWVEGGNVTTNVVTAAAPVSIGLVASLINTDYDAKLKGALLETIKGRITAHQTVAAAANTDSTLIFGLIVADANVTAANLDPSTAAGRVRDWVWREYFHFPFDATHVPTAPGVIEDSRYINANANRLFHSNTMELWAVFAVTGGVAASYSVRFNTRTLLRLP